jgi:hypothetical protein
MRRHCTQSQPGPKENVRRCWLVCLSCQFARSGLLLTLVDLSDELHSSHQRIPPDHRIQRPCHRAQPWALLKHIASRLFYCLDAMFNGGIRLEDFEEVFVQCDVCLLVMTRIVFAVHVCQGGDTDEEEQEKTDEDEEV